MLASSDTGVADADPELSDEKMNSPDTWKRADEGMVGAYALRGVSREEEEARKKAAEEAIRAYLLAEYWAKKAAGQNQTEEAAR